MSLNLNALDSISGVNGATEAKAESLKIKCLKINLKDSNFPLSLKNIKSPPSFIYVMSKNFKSFDWRKKGIAVIGSRNCDSYGRDVVLNLVPRFVEKSLVVVSGLAEGIDSFAHETAIKCGGLTMGVLGFGFGYIEKFSNYGLCKLILERGGVLLSPFLPSVPPSKESFLIRNSLIAALSDAILVVEAARRSGCMFVVEEALNLGKDVYAVPGSIFSYNSMGTNDLIKQGARVATCFEDFDF